MPSRMYIHRSNVPSGFLYQHNPKSRQTIARHHLWRTLFLSHLCHKLLKRQMLQKSHSSCRFSNHLMRWLSTWYNFLPMYKRTGKLPSRSQKIRVNHCIRKLYRGHWQSRIPSINENIRLSYRNILRGNKKTTFFHQRPMAIPNAHPRPSKNRASKPSFLYVRPQP